MIAFKGFNKQLECTMGRGRFKYEIGKTYNEKECMVASKGFHCVEEPIRCLDWYSDRFCIVKIDGDINMRDNKVTATQMTILQEVDITQLAVHECLWIQKHYDREMSSRICNDEGFANDSFVIVRGKHPMAAGEEKTTLFLLQEEFESKRIKKIVAIYIDGKIKKASTFYNINEKEVIANAGKRRTSKIKKIKSNT